MRSLAEYYIETALEFVWFNRDFFLANSADPAKIVKDCVRNVFSKIGQCVFYALDDLKLE